MSEPLLQVVGLTVKFGRVAVLDAVSFDLHAGETLGLVGESGSGKSTLARAVLRLIPAAAGRVLWCGEDLLTCSSNALRRRRRDLQIVFQDPLGSLNPRLTIAAALGEPLRVFDAGLTAMERDARVVSMLERVGLSSDMAQRYPHQFSGGQCQRIGIARAMLLRPKLLICDEPVSSLDVSIQGQIVNLLGDLQKEWGFAMLFISHNLAVIRHLSHRVLVLYRGMVMETAPRDALFAGPAHPYTRALLAAVPDPARAFASRALTLDDPADGAPTPGTRDPTGCPYSRRCSHAQPVCAALTPVLEHITPEHAVACHRWREVVYS